MIEAGAGENNVERLEPRAHPVRRDHLDSWSSRQRDAGFLGQNRVDLVNRDLPGGPNQFSENRAVISGSGSNMRGGVSSASLKLTE